MPIVGIIAEYNPFHNGHFEQIKAIKSHLNDVKIIAIMSGNITQRGEVALFDKWVRAKAAILSGVDLAIELPSVFAIRSAQHFAMGGVSLLNRLKIVDFLAFSSENPSEELLSKLARMSIEEKIQAKISSLIGDGYSYAHAMGSALAEGADVDPRIIRSPNNILGIEYLKALQKTSSSLEPLILPRKGTGHSSLDIIGSTISSTAIRTLIKNKDKDPSKLAQILQKFIPEKSLKVLEPLIEKDDLPVDNALFLPLVARLNFTSDEELYKVYNLERGLAHRLRRCMNTAHSMEELLDLATSKRYQKSLLRRVFIYLLLGIKREEVQNFDLNGPLYARILAFNESGRYLLRKIKKEGDIPLFTRIAQKIPRTHRFKDLPIMERMLALDTFATDLLSISYPKKKPLLRDFFFAPIYQKTE